MYTQSISDTRINLFVIETISSFYSSIQRLFCISVYLNLEILQQTSYIYNVKFVHKKFSSIP